MATDTHTDYLIGVRVEHDPGDAPHIDDVIESVNASIKGTDGYGVAYGPTEAMLTDGRCCGDPEGFDWYGATR